MNLKKFERYLRVNLLGPSPRLIKKIYRAAVSRRLRNTALDCFFARIFTFLFYLPMRKRMIVYVHVLEDDFYEELGQKFILKDGTKLWNILASIRDLPCSFVYTYLLHGAESFLIS